MTESKKLALFVVPVPNEMTPTAARRGLRIRAQATIRRRCACGASLAQATELAHEPHCPAISDAVVAAVEQGLVSWAALPVRLSPKRSVAMAALPAAAPAGKRGLGGAA